MLDYRIKYQGVLFLNASDIQANTKNISTLMNEFVDKELIPNTFQELSNILPIPQNRFKLSSPNNEWVISFGSTRIDFEKNPTSNKGENLGELKDFCIEAKNTFSRILKLYPRKATRIALVSRFLLKELSEPILQDIYLRLFNAPQLYQDNKPFEWNWRSVSMLKKQIDSLSEEFNFVTSINRIRAEFIKMRLESRVEKEASSIDRIELNFDINSSAHNVDNRYGTPEIEQFYDSASIWHDDLLTELLNFFQNEKV